MKKHLIAFACAATACFNFTPSRAQTISTIAGTGAAAYTGDGGAAVAGTINHPAEMVADATGNIYFAEQWNHCIRKISSSGIISTVAGTGIAGYGGDGGAATAAQLNTPYGIALDASGNLYIGDAFNQRVRKVDVSGIITTIAGTGIGGYSGDGGAATAAKLYNPMYLTLDPTGNIYICDNQNQRVRKITTTGTISTIAGNGTSVYSGDGGAATAAGVPNPNGLWADNLGNVFISQPGNHVVRKVNTSGIINTIAGTGIGGYSGDGGPSTAAKLNYPHQLYFDGTGNLFLADAQNNRIRMISPTGIISTVAGIGTAGFSGDGGPATAAQITYPLGICIDNLSRLCITDVNNNRIRRMGPNINIPTFTAGAVGALTLCVDELPMPTPINSLLAVSDLDAGQTLTWSVVTTPMHGSLSASYVTTSTGGTVTPTRTTYMPTAGYTGSDMFKVQVSDGTAYDTITIMVTVFDLPNAGVISGTDSVCVGNSVTLSSSSMGGVWTHYASGITTGTSSGIVTGVTAGIDTVIYTVTNACGTATAKMPIKVLPLPNAGVISGIDSVCPGKTITLSETVPGGVWSHVISGVTTVSSTGIVSGAATGVDTIVYSVTNSCGIAKAKYVVKVLSPSICQKMALGIADMEKECVIYPNPSNGRFNILISSAASTEVKVSITDMAGRKLEEFTVQTNTPSELATRLAPGVYILNAVSDRSVISSKITVTPQEP